MSDINIGDLVSLWREGFFVVKSLYQQGSEIRAKIARVAYRTYKPVKKGKELDYPISMLTKVDKTTYHYQDILRLKNNLDLLLGMIQ